jgi:predicted HAD superfamily Cof-like phosphohydrolase
MTQYGSITKHRTKWNSVSEFHRAMGLAINVTPTSDLIGLRALLIEEEAKEVDEAFQALALETDQGNPGTKDQWANLLKELVDLQYVLSGAIISLSPIHTNFDPAFNLVHKSNMSKLGDDGKPVYRSDGKVIKGPNYKAPDLSSLVKC